MYNGKGVVEQLILHRIVYPALVSGCLSEVFLFHHEGVVEELLMSNLLLS